MIDSTQCSRLQYSMQIGSARRPSQHRGQALRVFATTTQQKANGCNPFKTQQTYERVLRYPDGRERRLTYPKADDENCEETCDTCYDETWEADHPWDIPGISTQAQDTDELLALSTERLTAPRRPSKVSTLPSSPADLLRYLQSKEYKDAQEASWKAVRDSYEVLHGCLWVLPKPMYVLACRQSAQQEAGLTYTLRTRITKQEAQDELTKVLKRTREDGSALIRVEELVDGVVAFEDENDAHRYKSLLEAEGMEEVALMQCDSHKLFRTVGEVKGVVVLIKQDVQLPQPDMLATSLRGQRSLEDL